MATAKNKLPTFGTSANIDESIVNNNSSLKDTGFQPNTTIKSVEMNTYMKMLINGMSGLIDSVYNSGVSQGEIKANSSADDIKNYIVAGLNQIIKTNKVNNATHADEATNVDVITNNDSGDNDKVKFSIGDQSFSKTVNNVAHATNAEQLDSSAGSATQPVYFKDGKPVAITGKIANGTTGNAATASSLETTTTFNISGDATGTAQSFDGTSNVTIPIDVKKAAALDSTNIGDATKPVYFDANGKPVVCTSIGLPVKAAQTIVNNSGRPLNAGSSTVPTYFSNGIPTAISYIPAATVKVDQCPLSNIITAIDAEDGYADNAFRLVDTTTTGIDVGSVTQPVYFKDGRPAVCTTVETANKATTTDFTNGSVQSVNLTSSTKLSLVDNATYQFTVVYEYAYSNKYFAVSLGTFLYKSNMYNYFGGAYVETLNAFVYLRKDSSNNIGLYQVKIESGAFKTSQLTSSSSSSPTTNYSYTLYYRRIN